MIQHQKFATGPLSPLANTAKFKALDCMSYSFITALLIASPHILYAIIWFQPQLWRVQFRGASVQVFAQVATALKGTQPLQYIWKLPKMTGCQVMPSPMQHVRPLKGKDLLACHTRLPHITGLAACSCSIHSLAGLDSTQLPMLEIFLLLPSPNRPVAAMPGPHPHWTGESLSRRHLLIQMLPAGELLEPHKRYEPADFLAANDYLQA